MIPVMDKAMDNQNILISGASVAGPALAYWLRRRGFRPTVVERTPQLRGGGYAVDFRGAAHLSVLAKMGLLDQIKDQQPTWTRPPTWTRTAGGWPRCRPRSSPATWRSCAATWAGSCTRRPGTGPSTC